MTDEQIPDIPGAEKVRAWFGRWPSFHDAEVLELHLNRRTSSWLSIHAWNMSSKTYEKDNRQYFVLEKHAIVTFELDEVVGLELSEFNRQNVLGRLDVESVDGVYRLKLWYCHGLNGHIDARVVRVRVVPGAPSNEN